MGEAGGLDRGYYYIKSAELVVQNNLLSDFSSLKGQIENIEKEKQESFWVNELISNQPSEKFEVSEQGLQKIEGPILLLLLVALLAGFISFAG